MYRGIFNNFRAPLSMAVNLGSLLLIATKYEISVRFIKFKQLAKSFVNNENNTQLFITNFLTGLNLKTGSDHQNLVLVTCLT